jgi:NCS1 family nucleobase:cation symporter-1
MLFILESTRPRLNNHQKKVKKKSRGILSKNTRIMTAVRYGTMISHLHNALTLSSQSKSSVSVWINDDIRPLPPSRRTWSTLTFIGWWSVWQLSLTNWQLGGALVASSLSVWQTMVAVILGRIIAAIVAILIGYIGAEWHIGFPVYSRVIWGVFVRMIAVS